MKHGYMITTNFYTTLRLYLNLKEIQIELPQSALPILDVLNMIETIVMEQTSKPILFKLLTEDGSIKRGTLILINGKNILDTTGLDEVVNDGDTVALFPPGGGG